MKKQLAMAPSMPGVSASSADSSGASTPMDERRKILASARLYSAAIIGSSVVAVALALVVALKAGYSLQCRPTRRPSVQSAAEPFSTWPGAAPE